MSPKISDSEKEKRRMHIIKSAAEVFKRKGYVNATMQDVVDETEMSRGWVYLYFSNKEDIMLAILEENDKETDSQINKLLTSGVSVWQGLSGLIDMMETQLSQNSDDLPIVVYEYYISGWKQPDRRSYLEAHYKKQHEHLTLYLQKGVENGEFSPTVDLDVVIKMMTSYFEGLLLHAKAAGPSSVRISEQLDLFKSMVKSVLQVNELED